MSKDEYSSETPRLRRFLLGPFRCFALFSSHLRFLFRCLLCVASFGHALILLPSQFSGIVQPIAQRLVSDTKFTCALANDLANYVAARALVQFEVDLAAGLRFLEQLTERFEPVVALIEPGAAAL